jgi:hypothetical protein
MSQKLSSVIAVIGIDIGKNSFHVVGHDQRGAIVLRQKWSRGQVEARLANLPPCLIGMEWIVTLEQCGIVFVHLDEFDQAFNAEVGERQDAVFSDAIDPDDTVLDFHLAGDIPQPILVFAELFGNAG